MSGSFNPSPGFMFNIAQSSPARGSPDYGNESEAEELQHRLSLVSHCSPLSFDQEGVLAQKEYFHSQIVRLLDVAGRVHQSDVFHRMTELVSQALTVACGYEALDHLQSSPLFGQSPLHSTSNVPQHSTSLPYISSADLVHQAELQPRGLAATSSALPCAVELQSSNQVSSPCVQAHPESKEEEPQSPQATSETDASLPQAPPNAEPEAESNTNAAGTSSTSTRRHTTRHKRSAFQKDDDARALLRRMRDTIQNDVLWTPDDWLEIEPLDEDLTLNEFISNHWPEEVRLYRAAVPPKLWDVLRLGRDMEFVYRRCTEERPKYTWRQWIKQHCEPHGIKAQVANRNRRMWRVMSCYPLMQFSSIPLRELNKNVCAISRCLSTDDEACRFWSQPLNQFLSTLPGPTSAAPPRKRRRVSARKVIPEPVSDGEDLNDAEYVETPDEDYDFVDEEEVVDDYFI